MVDARGSRGDPRAVRQALFPAPPWTLLLPARFSGMERLRWKVLSGSGMHPRGLWDSDKGSSQSLAAQCMMGSVLRSGQARTSA